MTAKKKPNIRRDSFWTYARFAVGRLIHFGEDDIHSTSTLLYVSDLPKLLLFAINDVQSEDDARQLLLTDTAGMAMETARASLSQSIGAGLLDVYDPHMFLLVNMAQLEAVKDKYLVRLDDFAAWCSGHGIEIDPMPVIETDVDALQTEVEAHSEMNNHLLGREETDVASAAVEPTSAVDPADLPKELDITNQAFRAVFNGYGKESDTFKRRIAAWVVEHYGPQRKGVLDRITTVANPDKSPGRKKR